MILPDKNIRLKYSLLNCGACILSKFNEPQTLSSLWNKVRVNEELMSYEKFLLTLDFLYMIQAIRLQNGLLIRSANDLQGNK